MTEPDQADLDHTRKLIDEAKEIARDLREATPDPDPVDTAAPEDDPEAEPER